MAEQKKSKKLENSLADEFAEIDAWAKHEIKKVRRNNNMILTFLSSAMIIALSYMTESRDHSSITNQGLLQAQSNQEVIDRVVSGDYFYVGDFKKENFNPSRKGVDFELTWELLPKPGNTGSYFNKMYYVTPDSAVYQISCPPSRLSVASLNVGVFNKLVPAHFQRIRQNVYDGYLEKNN